MTPDLHVIIPAGGAGTRLWPLSRRARPKFLLDLTGSGRTLLQATIDRLSPRAASMTIVTGAAHRDAVAAQLPEFAGARSDRELVIEPSGRDSMPAIGLATAIVRERHGTDALVGSFAADHVIARPDLFLEAVDAACAAARRGYVTTIGITPTEASTAYGYIHAGEALEAEGAPPVPAGESGTRGEPRARAVSEFVEKPDAATARRYVADGYLWNAGMFVMRAGVLMGHLERLHPALAAGLTRIARSWDTPSRDRELARTWPTLTAIAIDHAIAEPVAAHGGVAVAPADLDLGWTDLGDFDALAELAGPGAEGTAVRVGAPGTAVFDGGSGQTVALVGVEDLVVVTTPDAVLVTRRSAAQDVKKVVDRLVQAGSAGLV
ncbi:MAG: mannose-1-phosphate guanylyltransferase [Actinomyces sp.]|jgi:mannose-1-phosphate guanylyltransferase|nr:mannose-1-phosphate guanylyltransferase [Actinomyces sp.]MCI1830443.1 mannose-1-phosphate guanylyltransferase [Actinomyces sp.]MCI1866050.1 mannose-1-phosphate guanylyltransferase [Actinomyces sp.]